MRESEQRLTFTDVAIIIGSFMTIAGCWMISLPAGLIGTGMFLMAGAFVADLIAKQKSWRSRRQM